MEREHTMFRFKAEQSLVTLGDGPDAAATVAMTFLTGKVKVENKTASATVKAVNMIEAIRQAANNKSAEIVFTVSEAESGNADTIRLIPEGV